MLTAWDGAQLRPEARGRVDTGNVVRVQARDERTGRGEVLYVRLTHTEPHRLFGTVMDTYRHNPPNSEIDLEDGEGVEFDRDCIVEIPHLWEGNENLKDLDKLKTGMGRDVTGYMGDPNGGKITWAGRQRIGMHSVDKLFVERWSSRAMSGAEIPEETLMAFFEAARWAPSSSNGQPWRALYARRGTPHWDTFFNLLVDFNKGWCDQAAALIVFLSKKTDHKGRQAPTHSYDTGSAWMSFALQCHMKGYIAHGMAGFDYERARTELSVPDDYQVEAMAAVGVPENFSKLRPAIQKGEKPSDRRSLEESICEGPFKL